MNCDKFEKNISSYIDNELSDIRKREFELHLMKCEKCRKRYESMIDILKVIRDDEQVEIPDGYREGLRKKLIVASKQQRSVVNWKLMTSIAASLLVLLTSYELISNNNIFYQGKKSSSLKQEQSIESEEISEAEDKATVTTQENLSDKMDNNMSLMSQASEERVKKDVNVFTNDDINIAEFRSGNTFKGIQATRSIVPNRKSIKEAYININVDELDSVSEKINDYIIENNGFVESMKIENDNKSNDKLSAVKRGTIKIRIPHDKYEQTVDFIKELGIINNVQCSISDVTEQYSDVESDLVNLHNKEIRLGEILSKVNDVEDIQLIQHEINEIKEQIEYHSDALQKIENSTALSTINTIINESNNE